MLFLKKDESLSIRPFLMDFGPVSVIGLPPLVRIQVNGGESGRFL
ncbi:hypothetical protein [Rossellomorea aquimaris]